MWGWIIVIIVVLIVLFFISVYNKLTRERNKTKNAWSQIDVQLKRRFDLLPNLTATVKGYAQHEKGILEDFAQARGAYDKARADEDVAGLAAADAKLSRAFNLFVNAVHEQYPELKADKNFLDLQETVKDTEAKIAYARQFYNDVVLKYNNMREVFPNVIVANTCGFKEGTFFKTDEETKETPKIGF